MREPVVQEIVVNGITYIPNTSKLGCDGRDFDGNCTISSEDGQVSLCEVFSGYGLRQK